jgi:PKD repeat protein
LFNQPSLQLSTAGLVTLRVSDTLGCFSTDSMVVAIDHYSTTASLGPDRSVCTGEPITLVAGASQTIGYQWSTGINDTLSQILIVSPGTYTLTATNFRGCVAIPQVNITMKGISPTASFALSTHQGCLHDTIVFTDQSVPGPADPLAQWLWTVGNNTTFFSQGPHQHVYTTPGYYPLSLKVTSDSGCFHTFHDTILIHPLPLVGFTPTKGCTGTPIQFSYTPTGQTPASYLWTFYSNAPTPDTSTLASPSYNWADPGSYPVFLRVTSSPGCSATDSLHVTLYQTPSPIITTDGNPMCAGYPIHLIDTGLFNPSYPFNYWVWNFGDGSQTQLVTSNTIAHPYTFAGSYQVTLTTGSLFTGCKDSTDFQMTVHSSPKAVLHPSSLCNGVTSVLSQASTVLNDTIASWIWDLEGKGLLYGRNPSTSYADTGLYSVSLVVQSGNGCLDTALSVIQVHPTPVSSFTMNPLYGTPPLQVNFFNFSEGAVTYLWNFGDGGTSSAFEPTYLFANAGTYDVTLISESDKGCKATSSGSIFTLQPSLDLELTRTDGTLSGDRIKPVVEFRNNSSVEIHRVEIMVWLAGGSPIIETWQAMDYTDRLKPGAIKRYEFNASLLKDPHIPDLGDIICARATLPEYPVDMVPENNHRCTALEKAFTVKPAWPNPTGSNMTLDVIIDMPDQLTIDLYNIHGQKMATLFNDYLERGLNRIVMDVPEYLPAGVYMLSLVHRDHVMNQRIIVL